MKFFTNMLKIGLPLTAFGILIYSLTSLNAQVENQAYGLMLNGLLTHSVPEITVQDAYRLKDEVIFLDARDSEEYEVSHIKGARQVGYDDFCISEAADLPKSARIIVYCSVGYRSEKVAEQLIEEGFQDVFNLYGGIFEWKNQGKAVVNEKGETEQVHAYDKTWGIWLEQGEKVYK